MPMVREAMTANPRTCSPDQTLVEVAKLMMEEDTGVVPIVENGRLMGLITDRDIVVRAIAKGIDPGSAYLREYATPDLATISPDTSIDEARQVMASHQIRRLPVVANDRLVGIFSLGDMAEFEPGQAEDALVEISKSEKTLKQNQG